MNKPLSLERKPANPWDRLRAVKEDPLEAMGFVSKGDLRLLDTNAQELFYNQIVTRYMQFCSRHPKDLDQAFASLSLQSQSSGHSLPQADPVYPSSPTSPTLSTALTDNEMSVILIALRKLREGLLASSAASKTLAFAQRVHIFNIRLAILAGHPESYHPSLRYLLTKLHTPENPLPNTEHFEMLSYLILDLAIRQDDLAGAFALRHNSYTKFGYRRRNIDTILRSIMLNDWVLFWSVRRKVDGYTRALIQPHAVNTRKLVLKTIGSSYLSCDVKWILDSTSDSELTWEDLVKQEGIGWIHEADRIIIRKPRQSRGRAGVKCPATDGANNISQ